jgi:hypothetical protein
MTPERVVSFLKDLDELTRKHQIIIQGCGCCGSPYLSSLDYNGKYQVKSSDDEEFECLEWIEND